MNLKLTIASLFFPTIMLTAGYGFVKNLPWNSEAELITNISAYMMMIFATFAFFATKSTLMPFFENAGRSDSQSKRTMGVIQLIQYSGIRVNNSPINPANVLV